jgi:hypothetical protein
MCRADRAPDTPPPPPPPTPPDPSPPPPSPPPSPTPPPPSDPPSLPPFPPASVICLDTCGGNAYTPTGLKAIDYYDDQHCDDGGEGSEFSTCAYGTDCTDCGKRLATGTYECVETSNAIATCNAMLTARGIASSQTVLTTEHCIVSYYDLAQHNVATYDRNQRGVPTDPTTGAWLSMYVCVLDSFPPPSPPPAQGRVQSLPLESSLTPSGWSCSPTGVLHFDNGDTDAPDHKLLFIYDPSDDAGGGLNYCESVMPLTAGFNGYTPVRLWGGTVPDTLESSLTLGVYTDPSDGKHYLTVQNVAGLACITFHADSASDANAAYAAVQNDMFLPLGSQGHQTRLACTAPAG